MKMLFAIIVKIFALYWSVSPAVYASALGDTCTITEYSQVASVVSRCNNIVVKGLKVPAGQTLHLNLKKGTSLAFEGVITFGFAHWGGPLVRIDGDELKVRGEPGSRFDGEGAKYWDGRGGGGVKKPVLLRINGGGQFNKLNLLNCPVRCASIGGSHIAIDGWTIDVSAGDKNNLGHNTDGFDVSGHNIQITNSVVKNQDDCVVVNRGTDMYFKNIHCSGGHGLSLAVGIDTKNYENNVVSNITYDSCSVVNSNGGIHVKTVKGGGPGLIENIVYKNIALSGITQYGIRVHQDYPANDNKPVGNVPIKNLRISHVKGTMSGKLSTPVNTECASGACSNWQWSDISITGNHLPCKMNYKPSGFSC